MVNTFGTEIHNRTKAKADPLIDRGLRCRDTPRKITEVALMRKGLRPALDTARGPALPLPSTDDPDELLRTARAHGYQHRDITVLYQGLNDLPPAPVRRPDLEFATA
jgi:hypothetical protein